MSKCNHPECFDGVMHEQQGFGIISIYKCPYCVMENKEANWEKSDTAIRMKRFIDEKGILI